MKASRGYLYHPQCKRPAQSLTEPHSPMPACPPPREGSQPPACLTQYARLRDTLGAVYPCEPLQAPWARLIPREGIYTAMPISARPAPSVRVLDGHVRPPPVPFCRLEVPRQRRKGTAPLRQPLIFRSISRRFPKNFRPVFENFSASFENRIFLFSGSAIVAR